MVFYGVDVSYALSETWKLTGYASLGSQTNFVNHSTGYVADINSRSGAYGLSLAGEATKKLQVGSNLSLINEINRYGAAANTGTSGDRLTGLIVTQPNANNLAQAAVGLPNVIYRRTVFSVFGQYTLNKKSDLRMDVSFQRAKFEDWIWGTAANPFVFSDNTTVNQQVNQNVTFVGASYIYRF